MEAEGEESERFTKELGGNESKLEHVSIWRVYLWKCRLGSLCGSSPASLR